MPTTSNGTAYTVHDTTLPAGTPGRLLVPDDRIGQSDVPLMIHCHGNNGNYLDFSAGSRWATWRDIILGEFKIAVAEATAGVSASDAGANNYGNDYGRTVYQQLDTWASTLLDSGPVIVQASSAGGMISAWLAAKAPWLEGRIAGWLNHRGVVNAHVWRVGNEKGLGSTPPATFDPEWQKTQTAVFNAPYGGSFNSQPAYDSSVIPSRDPMLFADADWDRVPFTLTLSGGADSTVPPYWHGTRLYDTKLAPVLGERATNHETPNATHGTSPAPSTYDESALLRSWLTTVLEGAGAGTPPTVSTVVGSRAGALLLTIL